MPSLSQKVQSNGAKSADQGGPPPAAAPKGDKGKRPVVPWLIGIGIVILSAFGPVGIVAGLGFAGYSVYAKVKELRSPFNPHKPNPIVWGGAIGGVLLGLFVIVTAAGRMSDDAREAEVAKRVSERRAGGIQIALTGASDANKVPKLCD